MMIEKWTLHWLFDDACSSMHIAKVSMIGKKEKKSLFESISLYVD